MHNEMAIHQSRQAVLKNGFDLFQKHRAMNLHNNPDVEYDYHKYNARVRGSIESFEKSRAKHRFCAIARNDPYAISMTQILFLLSLKHGGFIPEKVITPKNFGAVDVQFAKDVFTWKNETVHCDTKTLKDSLIDKDLMANATESVDGNVPVILKKFMANEIHWMTVVGAYDNLKALQKTLYDMDDSEATIANFAIDKIAPYLNFIDINVKRNVKHTLMMVW